MKKAGLALVCLILLTGCDLMAQINSKPITMKITTRKVDTRIEPVIWGDAVLLNIHSESGIDTAEVEFTSSERPTKVILRLYLQGLEGMGFAYGEKRIRVSLSRTPQTFREGVVLDGKEQTLTSTSPYWMPAKVVWENDKPRTIRYIEIAVPQDFLAGDYRKFTIGWIDFFRG